MIIFSNLAYLFQRSGSRRHSEGKHHHPSFFESITKPSPQLNVDVCRHLAELGAKLKFTLVYISTGKPLPGSNVITIEYPFTMPRLRL